MQEKRYITYIVQNKNDKRIYIGCTDQSKELRWESHVAKSTVENPKTRFHKAIKKAGPDAFTVRELQSYSCREDMLKGEIRYIGYFNSFSFHNYNSTPGGDGGPTLLGQPHGEEWNAKISDAHVGKEQFHNRISLSDEKKIIDRYTTSTISAYKLAKELNCYRSRIYAVLKRNNISIRESNYIGHAKPMIFTDAQEVQIAQEYCRNKISRSELARKYKIGKTTMREILLRNKVDLKNRIIKS